MGGSSTHVHIWKPCSTGTIYLHSGKELRIVRRIACRCGEVRFIDWDGPRVLL